MVDGTCRARLEIAGNLHALHESLGYRIGLDQVSEASRSGRRNCKSSATPRVILGVDFFRGVSLVRSPVIRLRQSIASELCFLLCVGVVLS